jgi:hypothetical protein
MTDREMKYDDNGNYVHKNWESDSWVSITRVTREKKEHSQVIKREDWEAWETVK